MLFGGNCVLYNLPNKIQIPAFFIISIVFTEWEEGMCAYRICLVQVRQIKNSVMAEGNVQ